MNLTSLTPKTIARFGTAVFIAVLLTACAGSAPPTRSAAPPSNTATAPTTGDATRGEYLSKIFACQACHSLQDATGQIVPATRMAGGCAFNGPFGLLHSANVTEIAPVFNEDNLNKVIRGQIISLRVMPTEAFNGMADQDMRDLIAYLHALTPISYDAPANNLKANVAAPPIHVPVPISATAPSGITAERGGYLVKMAGCSDCHTPQDAQGQPDPTRMLAGGGAKFPGPDNTFYQPPNLTPDKATGLGNWTDAQIADAIRNGVAPDGHTLNPVMPYRSAYGAFTDDDIAAVVAYLRSLPPVSNILSANPHWQP